MSVNGVTNNVSSCSNTYKNSQVKGNKSEEKDTQNVIQDTKNQNTIDDTAAVYEASSSDSSSSKSKTYTPNPELVNKLKMDSEAHVKQLEDIVAKLINKQGTAYNIANGLKSFYEGLEVDEETAAQAKKDIAEDGYWGVDQTSSRIFDFAMALTGGDPDKMEEMRGAFQKGFDNATKAWGDKLPDISQRTYDSVMKKFDDYKEANSQISETES